MPAHAPHTVVIGAGIVGACCALELLARGHRVTLLEPHAPGGEQAASYGNGAWISPASVVPMSLPGLWRRLPSYLFSSTSPLTIHWRALPRLAPWLWRFFWAGASLAKVQRTAQALSALLHDAPQRHAALASAANVPHLIKASGLIYAYPDRAAFEADALAWQLRANNGVAWNLLTGEALRRAAPDLLPHYGFGVRVSAGAHCTNPGAYVAALVALALQNGAVLAAQSATGFCFEGAQLKAVTTLDGDLPCDHAVVAAGIHSKALARAAGDAVCLESERGYHVELPQASIQLPTPIMPSDGKMANTRCEYGVRAAGQVELCAVDAPPNWASAKVLLHHLEQSYGPQNTQGMRLWMGHRPSTPHGLPMIQASSRSPQVVYAFGHGHVGLAAAPATAQRVAALFSHNEVNGV